VKTQPNTAPEPEERRTFTRYLATVWSMDSGQELNDDIRGFLAGHPEWGSGM
jgi:hypothetical protein